MGKYLIHYKERSIKDLTPLPFIFSRLGGSPCVGLDEGMRQLNAIINNYKELNNGNNQ